MELALKHRHRYDQILLVAPTSLGHSVNGRRFRLRGTAMASGGKRLFILIALAHTEPVNADHLS